MVHTEDVVFVAAFQTHSISVVSLLSVVISVNASVRSDQITRQKNESHIMLVVMVWSFG